MYEQHDFAIKCCERFAEVKRVVLSLLGLKLETERSSSSSRNAVNGVITTDRRSGVYVAAPTNNREEEKRDRSLS